MERDSESLLVIKTRADRFAELEAAVAALHPYELFELVALPVEPGNAAYLSWIDSVLHADSSARSDWRSEPDRSRAGRSLPCGRNLGVHLAEVPNSM